MTLDAQTLSAKSRSERGVLLVLSAVAGVTVAGLFLIEPLLGAIARQFGVSMGIAVPPVVAAQVGFAFALAFGALVIDHVEQRALLAALLVLSTIALVGVGLAPGFWWAVVAMGGVGISATAALVAVRLVANFADGQYPGRAVGVVMPGLLVGISASGTAGGLIAAELSWRDVFMVAAGVQLALSMIVVEIIPAGAPASARRSYAAFAPSVSRLIALSPMLRGRTLLPFLATPGFITVWASTAFALAGLGSANYRFSEPDVGLPGAFGAAGAPGVSGVDRFADRDPRPDCDHGCLRADCGRVVAVCVGLPLHGCAGAWITHLRSRCEGCSAIRSAGAVCRPARYALREYHGQFSSAVRRSGNGITAVRAGVSDRRLAGTVRPGRRQRRGRTPHMGAYRGRR
ncbi:MFS transporter [Mycobacterium montefiorense]|nr:MFS transporter [Mycobacterium montefiorense]MCV7429343.1 MFS transporter [Mycobacterium montefiorense]